MSTAPEVVLGVCEPAHAVDASPGVAHIGATTDNVPSTVTPAPSTFPILPGAATVGVPARRAVRVPTAKQLEALEANRKKRQAEAAVRRAEKLAQKASLVASIPMSQAAKTRNRSADIAELPDVLRRMETKFEARMQTVMDAMTKMQRVASQSSSSPIPQRFFPRPTKGVLSLLQPSKAADSSYRSKLFHGSNAAKRGGKYYSEDESDEPEEDAPVPEKAPARARAGSVSFAAPAVSTFSNPVAPAAADEIIDLCSDEEGSVDDEDADDATNPF